MSQESDSDDEIEFNPEDFSSDSEDVIEHLLVSLDSDDEDGEIERADEDGEIERADEDGEIERADEDGDEDDYEGEEEEVFRGRSTLLVWPIQRLQFGLRGIALPALDEEMVSFLAWMSETFRPRRPFPALRLKTAAAYMKAARRFVFFLLQEHILALYKKYMLEHKYGRLRQLYNNHYATTYLIQIRSKLQGAEDISPECLTRSELRTLVESNSACQWFEDGEESARSFFPDNPTVLRDVQDYLLKCYRPDLEDPTTLINLKYARSFIDEDTELAELSLFGIINANDPEDLFLHFVNKAVRVRRLRAESVRQLLHVITFNFVSMHIFDLGHAKTAKIGFVASNLLRQLGKYSSFDSRRRKHSNLHVNWLQVQPVRLALAMKFLDTLQKYSTPADLVAAQRDEGVQVALMAFRVAASTLLMTGGVMRSEIIEQLEFGRSLKFDGNVKRWYVDTTDMFSRSSVNKTSDKYPNQTLYLQHVWFPIKFLPLPTREEEENLSLARSNIQPDTAVASSQEEKYAAPVGAAAASSQEEKYAAPVGAAAASSQEEKYAAPVGAAAASSQEEKYAAPVGAAAASSQASDGKNHTPWLPPEAGAVWGLGEQVSLGDFFKGQTKSSPQGYFSLTNFILFWITNNKQLVRALSGDEGESAASPSLLSSAMSSGAKRGKTSTGRGRKTTTRSVRGKTSTGRGRKTTTRSVKGSANKKLNSAGGASKRGKGGDRKARTRTKKRPGGAVRTGAPSSSSSELSFYNLIRVADDDEDPEADAPANENHPLFPVRIGNKTRAFTNNPISTKWSQYVDAQVVRFLPEFRNINQDEALTAKEFRHLFETQIRIIVDGATDLAPSYKKTYGNVLRTEVAEWVLDEAAKAAGHTVQTAENNYILPDLYRLDSLMLCTLIDEVLAIGWDLDFVSSRTPGKTKAAAAAVYVSLHDGDDQVTRGTLFARIKPSKNVLNIQKRMQTLGAVEIVSADFFEKNQDRLHLFEIMNERNQRTMFEHERDFRRLPDRRIGLFSFEDESLLPNQKISGQANTDESKALAASQEVDLTEDDGGGNDESKALAASQEVDLTEDDGGGNDESKALAASQGNAGWGDGARVVSVQFLFYLYDKKKRLNFRESDYEKIKAAFPHILFVGESVIEALSQCRAATFSAFWLPTGADVNYVCPFLPIHALPQPIQPLEKFLAKELAVRVKLVAANTEGEDGGGAAADNEAWFFVYDAHASKATQKELKSVHRRLEDRIEAFIGRQRWLDLNLFPPAEGGEDHPPSIRFYKSATEPGRDEGSLEDIFARDDWEDSDRSFLLLSAEEPGGKSPAAFFQFSTRPHLKQQPLVDRIRREASASL
jgi:hypothetical protein